MTARLRSVVVAVSLLASVFIGAPASHAQKIDPFASLAGLNPVGVAASTTRLLVTGGTCSEIFSISAASPHTASLYATLPAHPLAPAGVATCESYMAASPGPPVVTGFPLDNVYVTQGNLVYVLPAGSNVPALFATLPVGSLGGTLLDAHTSIAFDTVGTFGGGLIVAVSQGQIAPLPANPGQTTIFKVASDGSFTTLGVYSPRLEGPAVVPMNGTPQAGHLLIAAEQLGQVIEIDTAGAMVGTIAPFPSPESVHIVPASVCTFGSVAGVGGGSFFSTQFAAANSPDQRLQAWGPASFATNVGHALVPNESTPPNEIGEIQFTAGGPVILSPFDTSPVQGPFAHEGSSFITCPPTAGGCPATKGFWKNAKKHPFPASLTFPVTIGGVAYSSADFYTILGTPPSGGNAVLIMGSQLIAALLNIAAGAAHSASVDAAIAQAESLLQVGLPGGAPVIFPINMTTGFVQSSTDLGQAMVTVGGILDGFNNGNFGQCTEGTGLTCGSSPCP